MLVASIPIIAVTIVGIISLAGLEANRKEDDGQTRLSLAIETIDRRLSAGAPVQATLFDPPAADIVVLLEEGQVVRSYGPVPAILPAPGIGLFEIFQNPTDGRRYVSVAAGEIDPGGRGGFMAVHAPGPVEVLRSNLLEVIAGGMSFIFVSSGAVGLAAKVALRRVDKLRSDVAELGPAHSMVELDVPATGDELERLARTLNAMIQRVRDEAARLDAFADDTAHELRNPLAAIRSNLGLLALAPEQADHDEARRRALAELDRAIRLVDSLLTVAKLEHERHERGAACEIGVLLDRLIEQYEHSSPHLALDTTEVDAACYSPDPVAVSIESEHLHSILDNLLDNSTRFAKSMVSVSVCCSTTQVDIYIADDGPGVPLASKEAIFERFQTSGGAKRFGLGLPLARRLVERAHGTVEVVNTAHDQGTTFHVALPRS